MDRIISASGTIPGLGFGASTLGNLYRPVADDIASLAVRTAIDHGIRYFDTAPFYGFGLSERRVGDALRERPADILLSTKVGRLLVPDTAPRTQERHGFVSPMPFKPVFDYSHDGILRSHAESLQRLGLARIDILLVHDIGRMTHGDAHAQYWHQLTKGGGFRALEQLRTEGTIVGFGLGVNETAVCLDALQETAPDVFLLAGRYTLLEQGALDDLLPACLAQGVAVVIGGPYNSGILATGTRSGGARPYNYAPAPAAILDRVARIEEIADSHGVPLAAAALQFPLAHPAVVSVVPGLASAEQVEQTVKLHATVIPQAFWHDLRDAGLLHPDAPLPVAHQRAIV
ncbi:aldo/keto reductase [Sphingomonas azotifigens]|uniref:aldo/keto reductase n=1 Tax=Sphingomonas azotifigens TaxID=330920 RepID=UPI0009FE1D88|nr:aldo/keto reductase [Sphingomonas azotifigens]